MYLHWDYDFMIEIGYLYDWLFSFYMLRTIPLGHLEDTPFDVLSNPYYWSFRSVTSLWYRKSRFSFFIFAFSEANCLYKCQTVIQQFILKKIVVAPHVWGQFAENRIWRENTEIMIGPFSSNQKFHFLRRL
jgi:hypothetical protein